MIELLLVVVVVGIIAALAIPNLLAARRAANEASAISTLRNYHTAQLAYAATAGAGEYAGDNSGTVNAMQVLADADLIDDELATGIKSGYLFLGLSLVRTSTNPASFVGAGIPSSFSLTAPTPLSVVGEVGHTGTRVFLIATEGVLYWESITGMSSPSELTMQVNVVNGSYEISGGQLLGN